MALTKEQRDKLSTDDFAFPRTRQCPMHDATHVKMAWDMVDTTKGVTTEERRAARSRIINRAKKLGVDTKDWNKIKAMAFELDSLSAMSLEMPQVEDHPNAAPFSGILTRVDQASDLAPHGSYGRKIYLPSDVAEAAVASLLGMAIDYTGDFSGHDRQSKIGVITAANVEGDAIRISGIFYANDFPKEFARIQANQGDLGFSFEAERIVVDTLDQDPLQIKSLVFTGAAVLEKKKAAYQSTSIAASAEEKAMDKEQFDALMGSINALGERVGAVETKLKGSVSAASVADKVSKHADALKDCADGMEAAGIGGHPTRGHVHILRHMADSMMAEAHQGKMPSEYHPPNMYASGDTRTVSIDAAAQKEIDSLKDGLESIKTVLKDIQAKASLGGAPERKTLPPRITALLAKGQVTLPDADGSTKLSVSQLDAALKGTSLSPQDRMEIKIGLGRAGILDTGTAR